MSNSNRSGDRHPENQAEFESNTEDQTINEDYRNHNENERPLLRHRAQRALTDLSELLEQESDTQKLQELEGAVEHLEQIIDCMADEPLPSIAAEALAFEEWVAYDDLRFQYSVTGSMPMLLAAFVVMVDNGVAPGKWILDPLADAFDKILDERDPELVALRLGLQSKGSGSVSPLQDYSRKLERAVVYFDMRTLIEDFGLSRTKAASAVIEKFGLSIAPKTLVNSYEPRAKYPDLVRKALDEHSEGRGGPVVRLTASGREDFLESFPAQAQKYLRGIRPDKT